MAVFGSKDLVSDLAYVKRVDRIRVATPAAGRAVTVEVAGGVSSLRHWDSVNGVCKRSAVRGGDLAPMTVDLLDLVAAVKSVGVGDIDVTVDDGQLVLVGVDGRAKVSPLADVEVPVMPGRGGEAVELFTVDAAALGESVKAVSVAVGSDDTLPMLTGIRVESNGAGGVVMAGTDRFRLVSAAMDTMVPVDEDLEPLLVPGHQLIKFAAEVAKQPGTVSVWSDGSTVWLTSEHTDITVSVLDCEYPKWRNLLPSAGDERLRGRLDGRELGRRLAKLKSYQTVVVSVRGDTMELNVAGDGLAALDNPAVELRVPFAVSDSAGPVEIEAVGYNVHSLAQMLASAPAEVEVSWRPDRVAGAPTAIEWSGVESILMPVRLPDRTPVAA